MASLHIDGLTVRAGAHTLLDDLHLRVHPGELCALLGPSGAGKSTLMKSILGLRTHEGHVTLGGQPVRAAGPVGYVPQEDALHSVLTVGTALDYAAQLRLSGLDAAARAARISEVLQRVDLAHRSGVRIGRLSGGQRKRVSVAMELLTAPPVLILDEPTSGLDPGMEARSMDLFAGLAREGRIVLVSTHAMASIDRCSMVVVLVGGKLAYAGPPADCAGWFGAADMNGIFPAIARRAPVVWARAWQQSPGARAARTRTTPVLPPSSTGPSAPQPSRAEQQLAELKARFGRKP